MFRCVGEGGGGRLFLFSKPVLNDKNNDCQCVFANYVILMPCKEVFYMSYMCVCSVGVGVNPNSYTLYLT